MSRPSQSAEEETAQQLYRLEVMCRHFGWHVPACYINAARMELLDMAAGSLAPEKNAPERHRA